MLFKFPQIDTQPQLNLYTQLLWRLCVHWVYMRAMHIIGNTLTFKVKQPKAKT